MKRRYNACDEADDHGNGETRKSELERRGIPITNLVSDRPLCGDALAEIALHYVANIGEVLAMKRLVETELMPHIGNDLGTARATEEHDLDWIAWHERSHEKHERQDREPHRDHH
jgi:hypothetical protein